ncbi:Dbl homology domain-containing protein, partial [Amylostereum chailletii]
TWRATLPSSAYRSLLDRYGEKEMQRQEVIWDLCDTEQNFVKRMRMAVRLFIQPLRVKDTQTWLTGVPVAVARLFDWLEDIVNLHSQVASALHAAISAQYPVVLRIAEVVRTFVPRLEVHQPYLVRVEEVVLAIKEMVQEGSDDFGEFVHMQQQAEECRGWTLEAFLVEPINRLVDYPMFFRV